MVIFLKIVSFPIRFVLFLVIALLSGIVRILKNTLVMLLYLFSSILAFIGSLMCGLVVICGIVYIVGFMTEKFEIMKDDIPYLVISGVGVFIMSSLLMLLPLFSQKLYEWAFIVADWLWGLAKMILFCDIDEIRYY